MCVACPSHRCCSKHLICLFWHDAERNTIRFACLQLLAMYIRVSIFVVTETPHVNPLALLTVGSVTSDGVYGKVVGQHTTFFAWSRP